MNPRPALLASFSLFIGAASAAVVNIDFNHNNGTTTSNNFSGNGAGENNPGNNVWNSLLHSSGTINYSNLLDSTGDPTSVGINITGIASSTRALGEQELGEDYLNLMEDYIYIDSGSASTVVSRQGTITGLSAGWTYEIYFYSQGDNMEGSGPAGQNGLFTVGSSSAQTGYDGVAGGDNNIAEGVEYVRIQAVANGSGEIDFDWANVVAGQNVVTDNATTNSGGASRYAALNGMQIVTVVPEASSALLGGLGLLTLLARRRR